MNPLDLDEAERMAAETPPGPDATFRNPNDLYFFDFARSFVPLAVARLRELEARAVVLETERKAQWNQLQEENARLREENASLSARMDALESAMNPQDVADVDAALRSKGEEEGA